MPPAAVIDSRREDEDRTLAAQAMDTIRKVLPGRSDIKMVIQAPIHVVADGYSWVAKTIRR